ncbi:MAG: GTP-binding protein [Candidatus Caenarcaniphilales bacterium]|nr:GTP-binding protein [Candidatus Caenarcaniphilales bacterium]
MSHFEKKHLVTASGYYQEKELLRFSTIGSVDDGKSTLIGRLLYETNSIADDQMLALEKASINSGSDYLNLALLTDGLTAEREQGITIDVAYRYFETKKRKFIIADCPGHVQYTRNMITGTSGVNTAVILVDARKGLQEQTLRHAFLSSLVQIKHLVLCVNKMDLVDFREDLFDNIKNEFYKYLSRLDIADVQCIPISALNGDNVISRSNNMSWYQGVTLLYALENINLFSDPNLVDCRFPIQKVVRPLSEDYYDYRGYSGRVESGVLRVGDEVVVLPSGFSSKIKSIDSFDGQLEEAFYPMCVNVSIEDALDISRGDMLVKPNNRATVSQDVDLMICWLHKEPFDPKRKYLIKHTTREVQCLVKEAGYKINVNTLHREQISDQNPIKMNDIGRVQIRTNTPLLHDSYKKNKNTGCLIMIDEFTHETIGAGLIL